MLNSSYVNSHIISSDGDLRSVASHFMLFSGVNWPKSARTIASFCEFWSRRGSLQVPKYFLPWATKAWLMLAVWRSITAAETREVKGRLLRSLLRTTIFNVYQ